MGGVDNPIERDVDAGAIDTGGTGVEADAGTAGVGVKTASTGGVGNRVGTSGVPSSRSCSSRTAGTGTTGRAASVGVGCAGGNAGTDEEVSGAPCSSNSCSSPELGELSGRGAGFYYRAYYSTLVVDAVV